MIIGSFVTINSHVGASTAFLLQGASSTYFTVSSAIMWFAMRGFSSVNPIGLACPLGPIVAKNAIIMEIKNS